jgi:cytochrome c oxidase subunit I+III
MQKTARPGMDPYFEAGAEASDAFDRAWDAPPGLRGWLSTINNIPISHRYMTAAFSFFVIGGVLALLLRIQLARPESEFLDPETYNQIFTMHGTAMMFLFVIPFLEALSNYVLPLLLGTRDLPFPRLMTLALWTYIWGGLFIFSSFLFGQAPDGGWFAYPPLTGPEWSPGIGIDFWDIGLSVAEIAAIGAAVEIIISVLRMRAPGMALHRMPIFAWSMLITAFMILFAFTPLVVGTAMLEFDRKGLTSFFLPEAGGQPLLWQHIFWIFGHPEVYIMFIPAVGMVSQILPVFTRRPLVSYTLVLLSLIATAFISFGLWVHHMFATGLSPTAMGFFAAASLLIAIPSGIQVFSWIATIWTGRPIWRTPMLFIIGFLIIFVLGGVTGTMLGTVPFDYQVHDSFFVVAHFHYVLIGGVIFPFYAALYYWLPKITGRLLSERLGRWNFWLMFVSFNVGFFPMHIVGLLGMPRRVYTYPEGLGWEIYNLIASIGAFGFGIAAMLLVVNFLWSLRWGRRAGANPWSADSLEWWESSPPPAAQFKFLPFIRSRHPLWQQSSFAPPTTADRRLLEPLRSRPHGWRGAMVVSVLDARPLAIVQMPGPTIWPFVMSLAFLAIFSGLLVESMPVVGAGFLLTAIALVGWFWPTEAGDRALAEIPTDTDGQDLPLAVAGPASNGWWGAALFLLIMAIALFTMVGSYFYLGSGLTGWPPVRPALGVPTIATGIAALIAGASWLTGHAARRERQTLARFAPLVALALVPVFIALTAQTLTDLGIRPIDSAYASGFAGLISFGWVMAVISAGILVAALLWAWGRPGNPRGSGVALIAEMVGYFHAFAWLVVYVVLFLMPRLW